MAALDPWRRPSNYVGETWEGYLVAPVAHNRDSEVIDESNWAVQLRTLEALDYKDWGFEAAPWEVVHEGHFLVGWVEWVAINPHARQAIEAMEALADRLKNTSALDEDDLVEREHEEEIAAWIAEELTKAAVWRLPGATREMLAKTYPTLVPIFAMLPDATIVHLGTGHDALGRDDLFQVMEPEPAVGEEQLLVLLDYLRMNGGAWSRTADEIVAGSPAQSRRMNGFDGTRVQQEHPYTELRRCRLCSRELVHRQYVANGERVLRPNKHWKPSGELCDEFPIKEWERR